MFPPGQTGLPWPHFTADALASLFLSEIQGWGRGVVLELESSCGFPVGVEFSPLWTRNFENFQVIFSSDLKTTTKNKAIYKF